MSVGYAEYHVDGTYFPGDYLLTVKASGAINEFGKEQYKAKATLFYENMIVDSVDYPFGNDRLTSITTSPNAVDNWAKLFDYARYSLMRKCSPAMLRCAETLDAACDIHTMKNVR